MSTRAHQGNTYRKNRRDIQTKKAVSCDERKMADLTGYAPKKCQYFVLDRVMCGEPGFPYCPTHWAVTHVKSEASNG